jgi:hypothetical protein
MNQPFSIVIRLNVSIPRSELEATLGLVVDRYEATTGSATSYAQIDIAEKTDYWAAAHRLIWLIKNKLQSLSTTGSIEATSIDAAFLFRDGFMSASALIPAAVAQLAGEIGIDIQISMYRSSDDDLAGDPA